MTNENNTATNSTTNNYFQVIGFVDKKRNGKILLKTSYSGKAKRYFNNLRSNSDFNYLFIKDGITGSIIKQWHRKEVM